MGRSTPRWCTRLSRARGGLTVADLNGDGKLDLAVANNAGPSNLAVMLNNGDGTFAARATYPSGLQGRAVAAGDVNGDGKPDLVVTGDNDDALIVFLNQGNGTFTARSPIAAGVDPVSVALADFDGDGKLDAAVASSARAVRVFLGDGAGAFGSPTSFATYVQSGAGGADKPRHLAAADLDADGRPDLAVAIDNDFVAVYHNACTP